MRSVKCALRQIIAESRIRIRFLGASLDSTRAGKLRARVPMVGAASRPNLRNSLRSTGGTPFPQAQSVQPEHCSQIETVRRSGTSICVWICGSSASNRVGPGGSDSLLGRCVQRRATGHSRMITQEQFWRPHQSGHDPCDTAPRHAGRYREERWVCH